MIPTTAREALRKASAEGADLDRLMILNMEAMQEWAQELHARAQQRKSSEAQSAATAIPEGDIISIRIGQKAGPKIKATGRILDRLDEPASAGDRWYGGILYQTTGGAYIADAINFSSLMGEDDLHNALILYPDMPELERQIAVMEHFAWTPQARAMAKRLGWKLEVRVD